MSEQWRPVPGWEGLYEVSSDGRVRSLDRTDRFGRRYPGRVLRQFTKSDTAPYLTVSLTGDGRREDLRVHKMVLLTFIGPGADGEVGRHVNGNSLDNRATNLAWGTQSENVRDAVGHGTHKETRKTHCPQGHLLAEPNLRRAQMRVGKRACRSCGLAHAYSKRTGQPFKETADSYYSKVMEGAA